MLKIIVMKQILKKYRWCFIIGIIVGMMVGVYLSVMLKSVSREVTATEQAYKDKMQQTETDAQIDMYKVPGYSTLLHDKSLLNALITMAKTDSIGLCLNLTDSVAQLMIKGVIVRNFKLETVKLAPFFSRISQETFYDLFSEPLQVTSSIATIDKEPVNVVYAPKDSSDQLPMVKPDTSHSEPMFFFLNTNKNVRFYFYQNDTDFSDFWAGTCFKLKYRWEEIKEESRMIFAFKIPAYTPIIQIGMSKVDAKVLYRALPEHAQIVLTTQVGAQK